VEGEHGLAYAKPLTRLSETIDIVRTLLRDGRVCYSGETIEIADFALWFAPSGRQIPIYVSAVFPKMTALAGEIADGVILTRSTLATAAATRRHLAEGAARAGRDPGKIALASLFPAAVADSRCEALDTLRPGLAFYAGFFPRYNRLMAEHGFQAEAAAIAKAWARGDRETAERATSDRMIEATSIAGTAAEMRERIAALRGSGIELPILSPYARGPGARAKFEAVIRACAPAAGESR
jgi:alkanesulfonate monooxygenase SsuD/methylene tetrahydromethanopterin reductase-like flavin-dependent oxidoreductase (luciferase family)